jgi:hypothetical protein
MAYRRLGLGSPLDANEGACGNVLLQITLDAAETDLAHYEWPEEGKSYREWLLPAAFLNTWGTIA